MSLPLQLLFAKYDTLLNSEGTPNANGTLTFTLAGTSTPQAVYSDPAGVVSLGNVVTLNSSGQFTTGVYLAPTGYRIAVDTSPVTSTVTQDDVEAVAAAFLATQATAQTVGAKSQTSYTVTSTDQWISMNGGTLTLLSAVVPRGLPLIVQSVGATTVAVTPNGSETINGISGAFTMAAAASPAFPALILYPDGTSNWLAFYTTGA
jgi:hypothetical protein